VGGWVVGSYPLLSQAPNPVEVELGCDKKTIPCKTTDLSLHGVKDKLFFFIALMLKA
jgi:hypothetical protein